MSNRLFKKHRKWTLDKVKGNYVDEDIKSKLSISKNTVLYELPLLLSKRDPTTAKTVFLSPASGV